MLFCRSFLRAAAYRRDALRQQDQERHQNAGKGRRRADQRGTGIDHLRKLLRQQHHGQQRNQQQHGAEEHGPVRRMRAVIHGAAHFADEIVPVPDGLGIEKHAIEQDGDGADEAELARRIDRPRRRQRIIGQDQRDRRQNRQNAEIKIGSAHLNILLAVTQAADQDADADQPVADDHHHRKHGIARQRRHRFFAEHDGGDQRHLDDGDGQRQQQRAVGLADPLGDHLGMMDGGEYRAEQDHQQHGREHQSGGRGREGVAERGRAGKQQDRQRGKNPRRSRHRSVRAHGPRSCRRCAPHIALTMFSVIFLASPSSIMVLSR